MAGCVEQHHFRFLFVHLDEMMQEEDDKKEVVKDGEEVIQD